MNSKGLFEQSRLEYSIKTDGNTTYIKVRKECFNDIQGRIIITNDEDEFCKVFYEEEE